MIRSTLRSQASASSLAVIALLAGAAWIGWRLDQPATVPAACQSAAAAIQAQPLPSGRMTVGAMTESFGRIRHSTQGGTAKDKQPYWDSPYERDGRCHVRYGVPVAGDSIEWAYEPASGKVTPVGPLARQLWVGIASGSRAR